jgi:hypothetical protein
MVGLCLVAVFALAAVTAASASAASPEWGKCEAQAGGKYEDSNCQTKAKGKTGVKAFEWHKGATLPNIPFTGESVGNGGVLYQGNLYCEGPEGEVLIGTPGHPLSRSQCAAKKGKFQEGGDIFVECEKENATGEASGKANVVNVHVTFKGCKLFGNSPCSSAGAASGEVKTNALKGKLGIIKKATKEVGVLLEPVTKHGPFANFDCGGGETPITVGVGNTKDGAFWLPENKGGDDQIISPITPVNQMTTKFTQIYSTNHEEPVENIPNKFEGKPRSSLESYDELYIGETLEGQSPWSAAGEEVTNVNTPEKPGEIKF